MNEEEKRIMKKYHVHAETPVTEWKSKIGYQIARIAACTMPRFKNAAFKILTARLETMSKDFMEKYKNFKTQTASTLMTEEELQSLCDATCCVDDICTDLRYAHSKYCELDRRNAQNRDYVPVGEKVDELQEVWTRLYVGMSAFNYY